MQFKLANLAAIAITLFHCIAQCDPTPAMAHSPADKHCDADIHITPGVFPSELEGDVSKMSISADGRRCIARYRNDASGHTNEVVFYVLASTNADVKVNFKAARGADQPKWINENLLFLRIWWGRRWGTDYVFNADTNKIVYEEGFAIPYIPRTPSTQQAEGLPHP